MYFCDKQALFLGTSSAPARGFLKKTAPGFPGTVSYSMRIAVKLAEEVFLFFSFHLGSAGFHGVPQFLFNHPVFAQSVGVQPVFFNAHFHEPFFSASARFSVTFLLMASPPVWSAYPQMSISTSGFSFRAFAMVKSSRAYLSVSSFHLPRSKYTAGSSGSPLQTTTSGDFSVMAFSCRPCRVSPSSRSG